MPSTICLEKQRKITQPAKNMVQKMGDEKNDDCRNCKAEEMFNEKYSSII